MKMYAEMQDVLELQKEVLRDGADGSIDNPELAREVERQITEAIQCAQRVRTLLRSDKNASGQEVL